MPGVSKSRSRLEVGDNEPSVPTNLTLRNSAFAGLASIIVLFPVPGLIAARIEGVQVKGMKMVCVFSEFVNHSAHCCRRMNECRR